LATIRHAGAKLEIAPVLIAVPGPGNRPEPATSQERRLRPGAGQLLRVPPTAGNHRLAGK